MAQTAQADDFKLTDFEKDIAKRFSALEAEEENCKLLWKRLHRHKKQFAKAAKLGRKKQVHVKISETHQVRVRNQFQGVDEVFGGSFCRKLDITKLKLSSD